MWDNIDVVVGKIYKGKRYLDIFIENINVILYNILLCVFICIGYICI